MSYATFVRGLVPPFLWDVGKRRFPTLVRALGGHYTHIRFSGDFPDFSAAKKASDGYDVPSILARTREALLKVKHGQNRWEQDAMVSDSEEMPWALLACLLRAATRGEGARLRVLDFGGSLGTSYFRCQPFLAPDIRLTWSVVEQPEHVRIGRADFANDELRFFFSIEEALAFETPDILLLSGVLQFLENPEAFLEKALGWKIPFLVLDRTPLWSESRHRLTIQDVPPEIYSASYPAWFLSRERILKQIEKKYLLRIRAPDAEHWEIDGTVVPNALYFFQRTPDFESSR